MRRMKKQWFVFRGQQLLLVRQTDGTYGVPLCEEPPTPVAADTRIHETGDRSAVGGDDVAVMTYEVPASYASDDFCALRASYYKLPSDIYLKAGKCAEILYWDRHTKYCGKCGGEMTADTAISKRCVRCGHTVWPQLATAIIVLVRRGDEILLVHANNFRGNYYGLVAGFVETGETLEEAVEREVLEETGLHIKNIRYYGSQPWPYPCGLMIGFFADYDYGEIRLQQSELASGGWYRTDNLPQIPGKMSIARRMIDRARGDGNAR